MKNLALAAIICGASILGINATTYAAENSSATPETKVESSVETQKPEVETQRKKIDWGKLLAGAKITHCPPPIRVEESKHISPPPRPKHRVDK